MLIIINMLIIPNINIVEKNNSIINNNDLVLNNIPDTYINSVFEILSDHLIYYNFRDRIKLLILFNIFIS